MNYHVGRRRGLDLTLLWLGCRLAAAALIEPLAWEPLHAISASLKSKTTTNKKKQTTAQEPRLVTKWEKNKSGGHARLEESNMKIKLFNTYDTYTNKITHSPGSAILYKNTNTLNSPFLGFSLNSYSSYPLSTFSFLLLRTKYSNSFPYVNVNVYTLK